MKKTIFIFMALAALFSLSSCTKTYFQVCTTKASDPTVFTNNSDRYMYEDENVKIAYNMWEESGDRGFMVFNKTSNYIFISSYNSCATATILGVEGEWVLGDLRETGIIAPNTWRLIETDIAISKKVFMVEGLKEKVRHSESKSFSKEDTPLQFANHINYYYYKPDGGQVSKTVVHSFYIDRVTNYKYKDYQKMRQKQIVVCDGLDNGKVKVGAKYYQLPLNRKGFYNKYYK